jgi:bifunctional UDP-N-acetylglucosamine pyrophosphorylase/glucosamine-1-phosphate N-acetyltransferase
MKLNIIIMAAGLGKRMHSSLPKVMHPIGGKPILAHLLDTARALLPNAIYVVQNSVAPPLSSYFPPEKLLNWVTQTQQLGTADAVKAVMPYLDSAEKTGKEIEEEWVLILCGDTPLVSPDLLKQFLSNTLKENGIGFICTQMDNPTGLGRLIRDAKGKPIAIVEERDATEEIRAIKEINTGIFCLPLALLKLLLPKLSNQNAQKEYYLTDIIQLAVSEGFSISTTLAPHSEEVMGVNTREQQADVERVYQKRQTQALLNAGVSMLDPSRVDIRGVLTCGLDVSIEVNTLFEGKVTLGNRTKIGANSILINCDIGEDVEIHPFSHLSGVKVGKGCQIGPYARVRPGTVLAEGAKIGNFVEVKKSLIGTDSKINHLSYIGDAVIGASVNIGAGTITCNYDGVNKFQTIIEDDVLIGSDSQLVAPVTIKKGSTIAAGSTITRDTEADKLTLTQKLNQRVIEDWVRPMASDIKKNK